MNTELKRQIEQIKCSFTVEGIPLVKSNRFTQEEYDQMKSESTAHISHWFRMAKNEKIFTDEEIGDQIITVLNGLNVSADDLKKKIEKEYAGLAYVNENLEWKSVLDSLYIFLGWKDLDGNTLFVPLDDKFWAGAGSAPYYINDGDSNNKLVALKKKYGACGMKDIFGDKFQGSYNIRSLLSGVKYNFSNVWKEQFELNKKKLNVYSSKFNSLDEIEDNVVVKNIKVEALNFYMDKTKNFDQRYKVFDAHGEEESYIHEPADNSLKVIFNMFCENDHDRHSTIDTCHIIEWWVDVLRYKRSKISYKANHYHPNIISSARNYVPSEEATKRLFEYYMEKLFVEGIARFEFDW